MFSAEDIAALKLAIITCNNPELKREILCAPGSDYYKNKTSYEVTNKKQWDEIVERKSAIILENLGVPPKSQKKIIKLVHLVGIRMLNWAEYHERILHFSREYSMKFLTDSFFTSRGIIVNEKAAEVLMKDKDLSIKQKYMSACFYCFTDRISVLYTQMTKEDQEHFYDAQNPGKIKQSGLVKFWTNFYQTSASYTPMQYERLDLYRFEKAIASGNKVAVQYCFEETDLSSKKHVLVDAAVKVVRNRLKRDDWIVFLNKRYNSKGTWVPGHYYMDILRFLLSKMTEDQQIHVLKQDTEVLECFLNWPYQNHFMNMTKLMWELLPERQYVVLLIRICDKIEIKHGTLEYGEDGSYDYRGLLTEFWCQSPERCKRYVFNNHKVDFGIHVGKAVVVLLFLLLSLNNFTDEDRQNINLILASANDKEKENIASFEEWKDICIDVIEEEKWEMLDQFVLNWFSDEADEFKRQMIFTKEVQRICINFVKNNLNAAESLIRWSAASEEEINNVKKEMIYFQDITEICRMLICDRQDMKAANTFCEWFFSSEDEFGNFKKERIFSSMGLDYYSMLALEDKLDIADEFTEWCFSSEEEINKIKKDLAYKKGGHVCKELISHHSVKGIFNEEGNFTGDHNIKFKGGKWEQVEKFLTWCFSSEKEISDFKKNVLHGKPSVEIHFNLIKYNQWEEAETFFAWLGLSDEEIKELKEKTLFNHDGASDMFSELVYSEESNFQFVDYGGKQDAIELFLRWYLTDKAAVLKFKDEFKCWNPGNVTEKQKDIIENFDLMIEQRLTDIDEEKKGNKNKSQNSFRN